MFTKISDSRPSTKNQSQFSNNHENRTNNVKIEFNAAATLADQISEYLTNKIIKLEIKPGERIIETKLAKEIGTSKAPVREALRILEKKRLVKIIPRKGTRVTEISKDHIEWISDIFIKLLELAGFKCVENGTDEDFSLINSYVSKCKKCAEKKDVTGYFDALVGFGLSCLAASRNPILEEMIYDLLPIPLRIEYATISQRADELIENVKIVETGNQYIQKHDAKMASKTAKKWGIHEKKTALAFFSTWKKNNP